MLSGGLDLHYFLRIALREAGWQDLFCPALFAFLLDSARLPCRGDIQYLSAHLLYRGARCVIAIDDITVPDGRDHLCHGPDMILLPSAQQSPANQVVELAFFRGKTGLIR